MPAVVVWFLVEIFKSSEFSYYPLDPGCILLRGSVATGKGGGLSVPAPLESELLVTVSVLYSLCVVSLEEDLLA